MPVLTLRIGAPLLLSAALLTCRSNGPTDATPEPGAQAGLPAIYVLRSVGGEAVPTTLLANGYVTIEVVADTLRLRPGGTGMQASVQRVTSSTPVPDVQPRREEVDFTYEREGERIAISLVCSDVILRMCIAPPHYTGKATSTWLVLETALGYRAPLRYERIPGPS